MDREDKHINARSVGATQFDRGMLKSERLLWEIAANYPNSYMSIINKDLTIGFTSGQEFKKQGLDPHEYVGLTIEQVFGEQAPLVKEHYLKTFAGEETSFELYINNQYQLYKTVPLPGENGEINHILVVVENISEQKLAQIALQHSEEKYRTLFETMAQGVVYQDAEGQITSANPAAVQILGVSLEEMQGRTSMDPRWRAIHEDGSPFPDETHPAVVALRSGQPVRDVVMGVYNPQVDEYRWINISAMPQYREDEDQPYQVYTTFEDITTRKQAELEIARAAKEWRTTFDAINDGIFLMDMDHKVLRCNQAMADWLERPLSEIVGLSCWELVHTTSAPIFGCPLERLKQTRARESEVLFFDGRWMNIIVDPLMDEGGNLLGAVHIMIDVTEQKQVEQALRQREYDLGERVKELNCLYGISALIEEPEISLAEILQGTVALIPPAWQYPEITCARVTMGDQVFTSANFRESSWRQTSDIVVFDEQVGNIEVYYLEEIPEKDEGPFLKEERNLINSISARLGRVLERMQVEEELIVLARTDSLTGLFNRRYFFELAERELERSRRYNHNLTCIMFDIDFFKEANDRYGHIFGDQVLQKIAKSCQEMVREVDILARYGGDEFVILLPETSIPEAQHIVERLRVRLKHTPIETDTVVLYFTISIGMAGMSGEDSVDLNTLLKRADRALYQSKDKGRDQVTVWQPA
jgi:diguanylate cyclase (GGDEF)-like protein/PAS domain S-box-containing protein